MSRMARGDLFDFGDPFDPQQRDLEGKFTGGPKPGSVWDVPKREGKGLMDVGGDSFFSGLLDVPEGWKSKGKAKPKGRPVDRRNGADVAKRGGGSSGVGPAGTLLGFLVIIAIFAAAGWFLIG